MKFKLEWELEEFIIDRLNGELIELKVADNAKKFYVSWFRRGRKIITGISITPQLIQYLRAQIDKGDHDQFTEDIYRIRDFIDLRIHYNSGKNSSWKIDVEHVKNEHR